MSYLLSFLRTELSDGVNVITLRHFLATKSADFKKEQYGSIYVAGGDLIL